jgi:hypothetical protein
VLYRADLISSSRIILAQVMTSIPINNTADNLDENTKVIMYPSSKTVEHGGTIKHRRREAI